MHFIGSVMTGPGGGVCVLGVAKYRGSFLAPIMDTILSITWV
jgi:hypothetical protein